MTRHGSHVLGAFIDAASWDDTLRQITAWAAERTSRYICVCNVHSVVTAGIDQELRAALNLADMATPDGAPVAWALRRFGFPRQQRISGPDLMWRYLAEAERLGQAVFFYGSTPGTLAKLLESASRQFPRLRIGGSHAPPYHKLSALEDAAELGLINSTGPNVLFVGLGCPKQEKWMAVHRGCVNALMIGVGAAFDYHAGTITRAPVWMQRAGFEWLHRLCTEPRRLYRRYFITNTLFIVAITRQLISSKRNGAAHK
jgi:N-acetylglucosaminyldiphosphoundecaprenol N-acetyl-beta-D-mannosaminyltransferase